MLTLATRSRSLAPLQKFSATLSTLSDATGSSSGSTDSPPASHASSANRQWKRPLEPGVNKAYDEALALIRRDSNLKRAELRRVQKSSDPDTSHRIRKLEIDSRINLPEVHWSIKNGGVDMSDPVHRHLAERAWRKEGRLDRLMERVHQMYVFPDVLPSMHPTLDLRVVLEREGDSPSSATGPDLEPGTFVPVCRTKEPPRFQATVFHTDERLYTLLIIDPDVPDPANHSFTTYLHLLQPNILLSAAGSYAKDISLDNAAVSYVPPHPQRGTPHHRYVSLLLPQQNTSNISGTINRQGFSVRQYMKEHGLGSEVVPMGMVPETFRAKVGSAIGGGLHLWRATWDEDVGSIYRDALGTSEPIFGRLPKPNVAPGRGHSKYY